MRLRREAFLVFCDFDPDWANKVEGIISDSDRFSGALLAHFVRRNPLILDLIRELRYEYDAGDDASLEHIATIGASIGSCVLRAHRVRLPVAGGIRRLSPDIEEHIRKFVADHLRHEAISKEQSGSKAISPLALARKAHLSPGQFGRRWKATTGLTPEQFLHQARLALARELLISDKFTVGQVADRTGFSDHSYFSVQFKRRFGLTPREYVISQSAKAS